MTADYERRVDQLETALVRIGNQITDLRNRDKQRELTVVRLVLRCERMSREMVDFATRLDALESRVPMVPVKRGGFLMSVWRRLKEADDE